MLKLLDRDFVRDVIVFMALVVFGFLIGTITFY